MSIVTRIVDAIAAPVPPPQIPPVGPATASSLKSADVEPEPGMLLHAIRAASDVFSRAGIARRAGKTFNGKRDLFDALGYIKELKVEDFRDRYERGDIGARVVEVYPKETWRDGAELIENEDAETETEWEKNFIEFAERLSFWSLMKRTDILSGLGPYAILLIGAPGPMESPLGSLSSLEDILYLAPYAADEAKIETWVTDTENERYGLPETYKLKRAAQGNVAALDKIVHWSRVIHVADNLLDDRVCGRPLLARVWNRLDDLDKVVGGGSEAFWLRVHQGTIFSIDKDVRVEGDQLKKLQTEAEEFAHGMRRTLAARGFEATQLGSDVSNFGNQVTSIVSLISAATGIPQRILLGSERGELASSQDGGEWDDRIMERRKDFANPIIKAFVKRMTEAGAMTEVKKYDIRWPDAEELDQTGKADVAVKWADLNKKAGGPVVAPSEIRDRVLGLPELTDAQKKEIEDNKPDPPIIPGAPGDPADPKNPNAPPQPPPTDAERMETLAAAVARRLDNGESDRELHISLDMPEDVTEALRALSTPRKTKVTKKVIRDANGDMDVVEETREEV